MSERANTSHVKSLPAPVYCLYAYVLVMSWLSIRAADAQSRLVIILASFHFSRILPH